MKMPRAFAVFCAMSVLSGSLQATPPTNITEAQAQIAADTQLIGQWFSDQLRNALPFNGTAGNVVPEQLKLLGFEVGVEGVGTGTEVDVDGLHNLGTGVIDTNQIDAFSRMPVGDVLVHAKIGLPWGLDGGVRMGGFPRTTKNHDSTRVSAKNGIFGIDLRKKLIEEGLTRPFGLTLGVNYTRTSGDLDVTTPYDTSIDANTTIDAVGAGHSEWDFNSYGVQAILNKKILFMNPYVGASAHTHSGSVATSLRTTGTAVYDDGVNPPQSQSVDTTSVASSKAQADVRALLGIEFTLFPFLRLGLHGEYAGNQNAGGSIGLRVQFH